MNHLSQEQLILYYCGGESDPSEAARHLGECSACRGAFQSLERVLGLLASLPVPERSAAYGVQVWQRLEPRLPEPRRTRLTALPWRWALAGAAFAALLVAAFLAGRLYPLPVSHQRTLAADPQANERVLLVAVGDYLERSQMVLIELANASPKGPLDISAEQERASDLVAESRLYRQTSAHTGDSAVASVLDELDRVLLDIAHSPSELSTGELEKLRQRLAAEGILFKIRVLGSNVRNREQTVPDEVPPAHQKL